MTPLLEVRDLRTHFFTQAGVARAVDGVSFTLARGEILGLVGESGSGKSVTGFSLLGLVDPPGRIAGGSVRLAGQELVGLPAREMRRLRGRRIAMVFQDPQATLNPVLSIGEQMTLAVQAHHRVSARAARDRAAAVLARVGIPDAARRLSAYPHEFSGGMRQRVAIATALLNGPDVIVADEPTTALDVSIQAQILHEVQALAREEGMSLIWISHDLATVSSLADRILVMYAGRIVESGRVEEVLSCAAAPLHARPARQPTRDGRAGAAAAADSRHRPQPAFPCRPAAPSSRAVLGRRRSAPRRRRASNAARASRSATTRWSRRRERSGGGGRAPDAALRPAPHGR
jgi:peptide/nickel transport system ATP-binding protein